MDTITGREAVWKRVKLEIDGKGDLGKSSGKLRKREEEFILEVKKKKTGEARGRESSEKGLINNANATENSIKLTGNLK